MILFVNTQVILQFQTYFLKITWLTVGFPLGT